MKKRRLIINRTRSPFNEGVSYLRRSTCEPILSASDLQAELKRRKEVDNSRSELERRLRAFKIGRS